MQEFGRGLSRPRATQWRKRQLFLVMTPATDADMMSSRCRGILIFPVVLLMRHRGSIICFYQYATQATSYDFSIKKLMPKLGAIITLASRVGDFMNPILMGSLSITVLFLV